ncbi:hypothetical protein QCA50_014787 [Cerrena zonata]|uniref:Uncharacterized protein n=1 Tax=Cerrena zonata TaxID=2478898 RepID=A0AAW0FL95_9APHY
MGTALLWPPSYLNAPKHILEGICSRSVDKDEMTFKRFEQCLEFPNDHPEAYSYEARLRREPGNGVIDLTVDSDVEEEAVDHADDDEVDIEEKLAHHVWHTFSEWRIDLLEKKPAANAASATGRKEHELWTAYLQGAAGITELLMADTRSVQPGIWNEMFELPFPNINRRRDTPLPRPITLSDARPELSNRLKALHLRIVQLCKEIGDVFGLPALERLEQARAERDGEQSDSNAEASES